MTNKEFCYWLQGYFEISQEVVLTENKLISIANSLKNISEPFNIFREWLADVVSFLSSEKYRPALLALFLPTIRDQLNSIFHHVIDNSYDRQVTLEEAKKIHDGEMA